MVTATWWWATKRAMVKCKGKGSKSAMARAERAMGMASKKGKVKGKKNDAYGNKEGNGNGGKRGCWQQEGWQW
jgi:hypothetical protein